MALLHRNREASFVWVQGALGLTPGNLDSHLARLEEAGYVRRWRGLGARGFEARVRITPEGQEAFRAYLRALRELVGTQDV